MNQRTTLSVDYELRLALQKLKESENKIRLLQETTGLLEKNYLDNYLIKYNRRFLSEFSEKFSSYEMRQDFFSSLVQYVADITQLDYVFIGDLESNDIPHFDVNTIAITAFGKPVDNIHYPAVDGPCEQVIKGKVYTYPEGCQSIFPKNKTLVKFNVEGYLGYPLHDAAGETIGLIAVMHTKAIGDHETVASILRIAAKRAENEMERIRSEETRKENKILLTKNIDELQEPLRKIHAFTERILEKEFERLTKTGQDYFRCIGESARHMQVLIDDFSASSNAGNR